MNIQIEIGDWSGDGHGKCQTFTFKSNLPAEDVREAYFTAREMYPEICPETFCDEYEDSVVPEKVRKRAKTLGFKFPRDPGPQDLAKFTAWFCMLGNPNLSLKLLKVDRLAFYGVDKKNRHIGFIGYGMF